MLELEERQEPMILGYGMDEAFLDYQSFKPVTSFWIHCLTFQFSPRLFQRVALASDLQNNKLVL